MAKYNATVLVKHYVKVEVEADSAASAQEFAGTLAEQAVYALESGRWDEVFYELHLNDVKDITGAECDVYDLMLKEEEPCAHCGGVIGTSPCEDCNVHTCPACWEAVGCIECAED